MVRKTQPKKPAKTTQQQKPHPKPTPRRETEVTKVDREEIERLHKLKFGTRRIAKKLGLGRKIVRRVLEELLPIRASQQSSRTRRQASKLDPFREQIKEKARKGLTATRILREIRKEGYQGGRTILAEYVQTLQVPKVPKKKVWRRFETRPGEETQFDWSPYRLMLGKKERTVHAFGSILGWSRKAHVRFYRNERESTLLEAHTHAFADFRGVTMRGVYDRMSTVVLGTVGKDRKPLWHPRFLEFARYYGYQPYLCQVRDPDRKGKDERIFHYLERDFLRGSEFDSLDDINAKVRLWLDEVANRRVHGTTRRIPDEAWEQERPFLIALPDSRYPAYDEELRQVGPDSVISVRGTHYTVPAKLAHQTLSVHLFSDHFEVCDSRGDVAFSRRYVPEAESGKLIIDPMHYEGVRRRSTIPGGSVTRLEDSLLTRFPGLDQLCAGIRRRMKSLAHVHLRALWRLADRYGELAFHNAAKRAQDFHRFDAHAVRRILERDYPLPENEPETPLTAAARALVELGDVDGGSLDDYAHLDAPAEDVPEDSEGTEANTSDPNEHQE